jgi:hypothetical protein
MAGDTKQMNHKLKVTAIQASELIAKGYTVECYVVLPEPQAQRAKVSKPRKFIPANAQLGRSVHGAGPTHGKAQVVWKAIDKKFFADPTITIPAAKIRAYIKTQPGGYSSLLSHLVNNYKVLRIIT